MKYPIIDLVAGEFPKALVEIPQPPTELNYRGSLPSGDLTIVGSRKYTSYGKQAVEELVSGLRGYPVGIVSGLALGIDSLAHEAALKNNLYTLSIPGGGLGDEVIYPARHRGLAYKILEAGGGLLSEFEPTFRATHWSFPQRNRLVAGLGDATVVVEGALKSGSLITARLANEFGRDVWAVPGDIFRVNSAGCNQLISGGEAAPLTSAVVLLESLNLKNTTLLHKIDLSRLKPGKIIFKHIYARITI
jgi:DNA processing protein